MRRVVIASCTQKENPEDTLLYQSLQAIDPSAVFEIDLHIKIKNKDPLPVCYNRFIDDNPDADWIVFIHDDVSVDDEEIYNVLTLAFEEYDVVGLAGCKNPRIQHPALWHIMAGGMGSGNLYGKVWHYSPDMQHRGPTEFGPTPERVAMIDGLFIAINREKVDEKQVRFDESNPAIAHHYDLDFSLECNKAGLKIGVVPIEVTHASPGLRSLEEPMWVAGNKWFLNKWS